MRIAVAQIDSVVGAFEANVRKIKEAYQRACSKGVDLLLTPELAVCGYPPHDLIERSEMFERTERAIEDLRAATKGQDCVLAVGHVARNPREQGRAAQNVVSLFEDGRMVFCQAKALLPTYDVFDEARYFEPAQEISVWNWKGHPIAFSICEDLWAQDSSFGRQLYGQNPIDRYREQKVELLISLSASPYVRGKRDRREEIHADACRSLRSGLVYVNLVGATDEILFDGGSFALDSQGKLIGRLPIFKTSFGILDMPLKGESFESHWEFPRGEDREDVSPSEIDVLFRGLLTGVREYFKRTGFKTAVIGLSGGVDSSVVAVLAVNALGAQNVLGVAMPSQYSSSHSLEDAEILAKNLGISLEVRPIKFLFSVASRELAQGLGDLQSVALENLQSRLRGMILMTLANHRNSLVLTTGNKSELATGYCTLYGDMVGALAPIGDLLKTQVYELGRQMNQELRSPIPERVFTKAPSAELKPNQTDQDTLPPYEILDRLLADSIERGIPADELEKKYGTEMKLKDSGKISWVREILRRLEVNEYKRRQAAPVLKISHKAFGVGRRIPIAKFWDQ